MKKGFASIILFVSLALSLSANAQKFRARHKEQVRTIKAAYKAHKVTENEYYKLLDEQETIKRTIDKYAADGYLDPHEKNTIFDKQERAKNRLRRYKTNGERY